MLRSVPTCSGSACRAVRRSISSQRQADLDRDEISRQVIKAAVFGTLPPSPRDQDNNYRSSYKDQHFKVTPSRGQPNHGVLQPTDRQRFEKYTLGKAKQARNTEVREGQLGRGKQGWTPPTGTRGLATAARSVQPAPPRSARKPAKQSAKKSAANAPARDKRKDKGKAKEVIPRNFAEMKEVEVGSFVEIRNMGTSSVGVYVGLLDETVLGAAKDAMVLTPVGVFERFPLRSMTFASPSFITPERAEECRVSYPNTESPAARSTIQELRQFSALVDSHIGQLVSKGAHALHRNITTFLPEETTVTAAFLLDFLDQQSPGSPSAGPSAYTTKARLYAAHSILIDNAECFLADSVDLRTSGKFLVRSPDAVALIQLVRNWVRGRSPEILSFATRAAAVRQKGRANPPVGVASQSSPLALHPLPKALHWSDSDLLVIRFLQQSNLEERDVQLRPLFSTAATILKLVDSATSRLPSPLGPDSSSQGRDECLAFLSEIGVAAPWEDWVAHDQRELYADWDRNSIYVPNLDYHKENNAMEDPHGSVRRDFGELAVYTIDDSGAKELDDGISIEPSLPSSSGAPSWWIHVHIADPTSILTPTHPLAVLARDRDHTEYFPERTLPMIPEWFSERNNLSLGSTSNSDRQGQKVLTLSARIDETGYVLDTDVTTAIVRNVKKLTYNAVDEAFGFVAPPRTKLYNIDLPPDFDFASLRGPERSTEDVSLKTDKEAQLDLAAMHAIALGLGQRRVDSSAIAWFQPRASVSVSPSLSHSHVLSPVPRLYVNSPLVTLTTPNEHSMSPSQILVSELMIAANRVAARFCAERGLPVPFRSQKPPTVVGELEDLLAKRKPITGEVSMSDMFSQGVTFGPAENSITPKPHSVMGINDEYGYVRATSPLRRYSDMLVHWQMKSALLPRSIRPSRAAFSDSEMMHLISGMDLVQSTRGRISKEAEKFWALYVLKGKLAARDQERNETTRHLLANLSCFALQEPLYSEFEGLWSQKVLIPELGLRGKLVLNTQEEAPGIGTTAKVDLKDIVLSNRPKFVVGLKE
ncbi:hypothetical protein P7C70_g6957, partial [Phenoliferia sp. Uapishka_3]